MTTSTVSGPPFEVATQELCSTSIANVASHSPRGRPGAEVSAAISACGNASRPAEPCPGAPARAGSALFADIRERAERTLAHCIHAK